MLAIFLMSRAPFFATTPGFDECPKCFGWQIRDLTPRDAKGWPIGPANIVDCDHCHGKGEVPGKPPSGGWGRNGFVPSPLVDPAPAIEAVKRRRGRPPKVTIDDDVAMPPELEPNPHPYYAPGDPRRDIPYEEREKSWDEVFADKQKVEGGWADKPAEVAPAPLASGWESFQAKQKPVDNPASAATGWAIFNEEPGNE